MPPGPAASAVVATTCPGCGADDHRPELTGADPLSRHVFNVVRCRRCRLAYVNPRPTDERLGDYYPDDTYFAERHPFFKDQLMGLRVRALGEPPPGGKLLDIGCGRGDFVIACKRRGWHAIGAEMPQSPVFHLQEELGIEVIGIDELDTVPSGSFDAVSLWHVFEHVTDPRSTLRQARRLLRDDGRLLIEVPNFGSWHQRLSRARWYHLELPRHLLHFERDVLEGLLCSEGFVPIKWGTFSLEYDAFGLTQGMLNAFCRTPNHLYQMLIRQPTGGGRLDSLLSLVLLIPFAAVAGVISAVAPAFGKGGVLRVLARKR